MKNPASQFRVRVDRVKSPRQKLPLKSLKSRIVRMVGRGLADSATSLVEPQSGDRRLPRKRPVV